MSHEDQLLRRQVANLGDLHSYTDGSSSSTDDGYRSATPPTRPVLNSITDVRGYGDERNSVLVKDAGNTRGGAFRDVVSVQDDREYLIRALVVHDGRGPSLPIRGLTVTTTVPSAAARAHRITVSLSASNARGTSDGVALVAPRQFNLVYIPGSARFFHGRNLTHVARVPDTLAAGGARVGNANKRGVMRPATRGLVVFRVRAQLAGTPDFDVLAQLRHASGRDQQGGWSSSVTAMPGNELNMLLSFTNTGLISMNNVVAVASLPSGVRYSRGSTRYFNSTSPAPVGRKATDHILSPGINLGNYAPASTALVRLSLTVTDRGTCGTARQVVVATIQTDNGQKRSQAYLTIRQPCTG